MSTIFGTLGFADQDTFGDTKGQRQIYDFVNKMLVQSQSDMLIAMQAFVSGTTEDHSYRYYKIGGNKGLQKRGVKAVAGAQKATGSWDVGFPLEEFGAQVTGSKRELAYMTAAEMQRHFLNILSDNAYTVRWEILHRLFDNVQYSFTDPRLGTVTVEPLANGDTVTYPPVNGSVTEAIEDHYLTTTYAASAISDTNDPYATMSADLEQHTTLKEGGGNFVTFINSAQKSVTQDLIDFVPVTPNEITPGDDTATLNSILGVPGTSRVLGKLNDTWVVQWDWVPASYMVMIDRDQDAPMQMRVDTAESGLPAGLHLASEDETYPLRAAHYENNFGIGCANRLNGAVMFLGGAGTYTIPTAYD